MRLRGATAAVPSFHTVLQEKDLERALTILPTQSFDTVFVSYTWGLEAVSKFLASAKEIPQGADSAYVLVIQPKDQNSVAFMENFTHGSDGFLCDPYSVDALIQIVDLSTRVKRQRLETRQRAAVTLLVKDAQSLLDQLALRQLLGESPGPLMHDLQRLKGALVQLSESLAAHYVEQVLTVFTDLPVPQAFQHAHERIAVSKRVREMVEKRRAKLEQLQRDQTEATGSGYRVVRK